MKVLIIGGGQVGTYVGKKLRDSNNEVKIIEKRSKGVTLLKNIFPTNDIIEGDGTDPKVLERAEINDSDVVAFVTGADETNVVGATIAKFEFGIPKVVARVNSPKNEWLFNDEMGVDIKVSQADILSSIIIDQINLDDMVTLAHLNQGNNAIVEVIIRENAKADKCFIKDLEIPLDTVMIAITRNKETIIPKGDTQLLSGDRLLLYTGEQGEKDLLKLLR